MKYAISKYNGEGRQNPSCPDGQKGNVVKRVFLQIPQLKVFRLGIISSQDHTEYCKNALFHQIWSTFRFWNA